MTVNPRGLKSVIFAKDDADWLESREDRSEALRMGLKKLAASENPAVLILRHGVVNGPRRRLTIYISTEVASIILDIMAKVWGDEPPKNVLSMILRAAVHLARSGEKRARPG